MMATRVLPRVLRAPQSFAFALRQAKEATTATDAAVSDASPKLSKPSSNSAALSAFVARSGLKFSSNDVLLQALTHKSFEHAQVPHNERLAFLGEKVLDFFVAEYVHIKYPNLPESGLSNAVRMYVHTSSLASVGRTFGVQDVMRWQPADEQASASTRVLGKTVKALIGALFHEKGAQAAKNFVHATILSRSLDMQSVLQLNEPKRLLAAMMKRQSKERPVSRMLQETGRLSNAPVFMVGVFSGDKLLGKGYGSSIKMAEHRAAKAALLEHFLEEIARPVLPSETLGLSEEEQLSFMPSKLGDTPPVL
ncbi:54S ribosomal protein L3 mitochondrial [Sorochytrium milnesiophthora]